MKSEGKARNKGSEVISKGVVLLILLMLAVQFIYFIVYAVRDARKSEDLSVAVRADTVYIIRTDTVYIPAAGASDRRNADMTGHGRMEHAASRIKSGSHAADSRDRPSEKEFVYDGWKWDVVELNTADSAELDGLPGIGPYYAKQIIRYRTKLWGHFHDVHQLLEIRGIDSVLFARIGERIYIDTTHIAKYDLYTVSVDSLAVHPYIGSYTAADIERFRNMTPRAEFSLEELVSSRVITAAQARRIALCFK